MRILMHMFIITLLYQVWGFKKHFLIETKNDHEEPTKDANAKNDDDYLYEAVDDKIGANQGGIGMLSVILY